MNSDTDKLPDPQAMQTLFELVWSLGSESRSFARTEILLHAMALFNQKGFQQASVQDVLNAAGISRRTFYKYFSNKSDVLVSIYDLALNIMQTRLDHELPSTEQVSELAAVLVKVYFDYPMSVGPVIGFMIEEAMRSDSPLNALRLAGEAKIVLSLQRELRRLQGQAPSVWTLKSLIWSLQLATLELFQTQRMLPEDVAMAMQGMQELAGVMLYEHR
ncbi:MAG: TetR family transcriptional regulator [Pseudomonadales bacterium]|nr:TetR family transcriptional regulator [Pseudomonadales bacterium]